MKRTIVTKANPETTRPPKRSADNVGKLVFERPTSGLGKKAKKFQKWRPVLETHGIYAFEKQNFSDRPSSVLLVFVNHRDYFSELLKRTVSDFSG
jgi:hypothetical protein